MGIMGRLSGQQAVEAWEMQYRCKDMGWNKQLAVCKQQGNTGTCTWTWPAGKD